MHTEQFDSFVEDFLGEKIPRPIIIIGASKVEGLLLHILSDYLMKPIGKDDLLEGDNPLATFSARIKICHRLGIIDAGLFQILDKLRKIRNLCAHSIVFDVKSSPVRDHIADLKKQIAMRTSFELTKKRYFQGSFISTSDELLCLLVTICVILEAIREKIQRTIGIIDTLNISKK